MPPAFSLRKCLGSFYSQSINSSCAPTCYLPILYQTRTLRIQYTVEPDRRQGPRRPQNRATVRNWKETSSTVIAKTSFESGASQVPSVDHSNNADVDYHPVDESKEDERLGEDVDSQERVEVKVEEQQEDQEGHHQDRQHLQYQQYVEAEQRRERRQPVTVPLEPVTSTLTPGEQNTFAKLFDMAASGKLDRKPKKPPGSSTTDQAMAERQSEEMGQLAASVLQRHIQPENQPFSELDISKYPEPLRPMVVGKSAGMWEKQQEQQRIQHMKDAMSGVGLAGSSAAISAVGPANPNARFIDVIKRMSNAKTDFELWEALKYDVFKDFKKLEKAGLLEKQQAGSGLGEEPMKPSNGSASHGSTKKDKKKEKEKKNKKARAVKKELQNLPDVDTFRANYPNLLVAAVQQLRRDFPTSSLALTVLAETKALGLVSYILGASTALYNESLDILWSKYSDLGAVDRLLHEMDNGGIDFDGQTLTLLGRIFEDCTNMAGLPEEKMLGVIWRMDKSVREVRQLGEWRETVRQRLEAEALRMVREQESEADLMANTL